MPVIKSAQKRMRQEARRRERNQNTKRTMRSEVKALENAIAANDKKAVEKHLPSAFSALDTAVKKHLIHKNKAARKKSTLHAAAKPVLGSTKKTAANPPTGGSATKKPAAKTPAKKT